MAKHIVSLSGGKDSTAMLLRMLEIGMQVDEIIFCDTGVEFPQMYEHLKKVEEYTGRKITILKTEQTYEDLLLNKPRPKHPDRSGYSFPDFRNRWCTAYFKRDCLQKYLPKDAIEYVGIAADEPKRIKDKRYPLVDWGWTEADCLAYCKERGFDWGGLYDVFGRVSCWCCPLKRIDEIRKLRKHFPELWAKLREWQSKTWRKFRPDYSVEELEEKFRKEDEKNV